jgi:hypothetical protein
VACADGSAGWNLAIGAGTNAFLALLENEAAIAELVKVPRALGAGSINPTSLRLTPAPGGYRVSGMLRYASRVQQSTWLVAGGFVFDDGRPRVAPDGGPLIVGAFFPTSVIAGNALERCWRDMHALTQHLAVSSAHYERVGRRSSASRSDPGPCEKARRGRSSLSPLLIRVVKKEERPRLTFRVRRQSASQRAGRQAPFS